MYTCGPTVYAPAHIGNFRAFLTYDLLKRVLIHVYNFKVEHVLNLTDVDDKIIKACREQGICREELTGKYTEIFKKDLNNLNIIPATSYPLATDYIDEMVEMILELKEKGYAYETEEGWWYDVSKDKDYGSRVTQNREIITPTDSTSDSASASESADFALWKFEKPNIDVPSALWDTPLGRGRPGWHIECSAISLKELGPKIDLHMGGVDLTFPHHENEAAQCESYGCGNWCGCWLHNGFVNIGKEKMSKSLNNFKTLDNSCPTGTRKRGYRWMVVSSYYRSSLTYTEESLSAAEGAVKRVDKLMKSLEGIEVTQGSDSELSKLVSSARQIFLIAVSDDLKMPRAAAAMFDIVKASEKEVRKDDEVDVVGLGWAKSCLLEFDSVFGILYTPEEDEIAEGSGEEEAGEDVWKLVEERKEAKKEKDWGRADAIRDEIKKLGWVVVDGKDGAKLEKA
ncbi:hypothetical protein TrLO_g10043 [Triparma laevis f. longispina]|nr:hypothetical protein TrLO_g10043 [Triparma laevis f. longispina]